MKLKGAKKAAFLRRMAAGRRKAARKGTKSATIKRKSGSSNTMQRTVRRSRRSRVSRGIRRVASRKTGSRILSQAKPFAAGLGGGIAVEAGVNKVAPQFAQVSSYVGAYGFGGIKGVIAKVGFDLLTGRGLPAIPNLGGGGSGSGGGFTL